MKGYLSKNPDGRYVISHWPPVLATVFGTEQQAFYPLIRVVHSKPLGDPLWLQASTLCPAVVEAQLKKHGHAILEPGESRDFESLAFLLD